MIGELNTLMLVVSDMERSVRFYRDLLGLELRFQSPYWSELDADTITLALHPEGSELRVSPGSGCTFGFDVDDIQEVVGALRAGGVAVITEPHRADFGGQLAAIADPDGYPIQLHQA
jgi:catechol 2,3-dioxygenase-like lactoylglutathione lyase family enzyme